MSPGLKPCKLLQGGARSYPSTQVPLNKAMTSPSAGRPDCFRPINTELSLASQSKVAHQPNTMIPDDRLQ